MWTMTPHGFFSAVQHRDDPNLLVVRTRDHSDADHLVAWYTDWQNEHQAVNIYRKAAPPVITSYEWSDYPWRVIVPKVAWAAFLSEAVMGLDYGNFKDAVKETQGAQRAHVYSNVWSALLRLEDLDPMGRTPKMLEDSDWDLYDTWETP